LSACSPTCKTSGGTLAQSEAPCQWFRMAAAASSVAAAAWRGVFSTLWMNGSWQQPLGSGGLWRGCSVAVWHGESLSAYGKKEEDEG
ncbi:hypothetical protein AOLI_G00018070, partial [Acnodon oligacanthus]